jgi:hypothetical protein
MQLQVNPLVDAHRHDSLQVAGARSEGEPIKRVQGAPLSVIVGAGRGLVLFVGKHLRDRARQAETKKTNGELRAAQTHDDSQWGQATSSPDYQPQRKEKVAGDGLPKNKEQGIREP